MRNWKITINFHIIKNAINQEYREETVVMKVSSWRRGKRISWNRGNPLHTLLGEILHKLKNLCLHNLISLCKILILKMFYLNISNCFYTKLFALISYLPLLPLSLSKAPSSSFRVSSSISSNISSYTISTTLIHLTYTGL